MWIAGNLSSVPHFQGCSSGFVVWLLSVGSGIVFSLVNLQVESSWLSSGSRPGAICNGNKVVPGMFPGLLFNGRFVCFHLFDAGIGRKQSLVFHVDDLIFAVVFQGS